MKDSGFRLPLQTEDFPGNRSHRSLLGALKLSTLEEQGRLVLDYRDAYNSKLWRSFGYFTKFEGYKCTALNSGAANSSLFDSVDEEYDLMLPHVWDGKKWSVSIYPHNSNINVSEIAKKYGGGGHPGAAGFTCKELPW